MVKKTVSASNSGTLHSLLHISLLNALLLIKSLLILNYEKGYPVAEAVVGIDWGKVDRTEERYKKRIDMLTKECEEVEEFVESIPSHALTDFIQCRRILRFQPLFPLCKYRNRCVCHYNRDFLLLGRKRSASVRR